MAGGMFCPERRSPPESRNQPLIGLRAQYSTVHPKTKDLHLVPPYKQLKRKAVCLNCTYCTCSYYRLTVHMSRAINYGLSVCVRTFPFLSYWCRFKLCNCTLCHNKGSDQPWEDKPHNNNKQAGFWWLFNMESSSLSLIAAKCYLLWVKQFILKSSSLLDLVNCPSSHKVIHQFLSYSNYTIILFMELLEQFKSNLSLPLFFPTLFFSSLGILFIWLTQSQQYCGKLELISRHNAHLIWVCI